MENHNSDSLIDVASENQAEVPQPALNQSAAFVGNFRCVGGACSDTCCSGWNVSIDKATHYRYKKSADAEISEIAKSSIKKMKSGRTSSHFSVIKNRENGDCPFMTSCGWCKVQSEMGEQALSKTCNTYPRIITRCGGETYISASLSCPEAARLCLENEHSADLEPASETLMNQLDSGKSFHILSDAAFCGDSKLLQSALLEIFNDFEMSIAEQFMTADLLMTKSQNARGNLTYREFHQLASGLKQASKQLRDFANDNDAAAFQLNVFGGLFLDSSSFTPSETFEAILNKVRQAIRYDDPDQKVTLSNYQSAKSDVFEPFNARHRYLIGNFVRTQMLATPSVFNLNNRSAKNQLHKIATKTAAVKFVIIGLAFHNAHEFSKQTYVDSISSVLRAIEHNAELLRGIERILNRQNDDRLVVNNLLLV